MPYDQADIRRDVSGHQVDHKGVTDLDRQGQS